jgi:tetratricopeptide (TPR) repeat protein
MLKEYDQAVAAFDKALAINPNYPQSREYRAQAAQLAKQSPARASDNDH